MKSLKFIEISLTKLFFNNVKTCILLDTGFVLHCEMIMARYCKNHEY